MFNAEEEFDKVNRKLDRILLNMLDLEILLRKDSNNGNLGGFPIGQANRWMGGKMPVPKGTLIFIKYRDGDTLRCLAGCQEAMVWEHSGCNSDIFEFTILKA